MRKTPASVLTARGIALGFAACLLAGCTFDQVLVGQWYTVTTPAMAACPSLGWHFVVNPQRAIGGFLSGDAQQRIANLSGVLNADDSFQMQATSVVGHKTAEVTGQFTSDFSTIAIRGDAAGSGCDGQIFKLRLSGYFARQGGGDGGGGR